MYEQYKLLEYASDRFREMLITIVIIDFSGVKAFIPLFEGHDLPQSLFYIRSNVIF